MTSKKLLGHRRRYLGDVVVMPPSWTWCCYDSVLSLYLCSCGEEWSEGNVNLWLMGENMMPSINHPLNIAWVEVGWVGGVTRSV